MLDIASDQWRVGGPAWGPSEQILHAPLQVPVRSPVGSRITLQHVLSRRWASSPTSDVEPFRKNRQADGGANRCREDLVVFAVREEYQVPRPAGGVKGKLAPLVACGDP